MSSDVGCSKDVEVQFYLDRSKESMLTLLRSIINNPRVPEAEQFRLLRLIAEHHAMIAELIAQRLIAGEEHGIQLAARAIASEASTKSS